MSKGPLTEGKMKGGNEAVKINIDNSWFSDRTKTIMVTLTMVILVGGIGWGYYASHQWQADREDAKAAAKIEMQAESKLESNE